jgi:5-methylcytosine-specific restriction endonuclease McrA
VQPVPRDGGGDMKIVDAAARQKARERVRCELCGKPQPGGCDPAHYIAKGLGGGSTLDDPWNLVSACRRCHSEQHAGKLPRSRLLEAIARREGRTPEQIESWLRRVLRTARGKRKPRKPR